MKRTVLFSMEDMPGWGLKRVLGGQVNDGSSNFFQTHVGQNVDVYLLDSGITADHFEFTFLKRNNLLHTLADFVNPEDLGKDSAGHGTGVASVIAGILVGVAPEVQLFNIRISQGLNTDADKILQGLEVVLQHHLNKKDKRPSVVNLSFVMKKNPTLDEKLREMVRSGIIIVAAAGDQNEPAHEFSPAGLEEVITVGTFDKELNFGSGLNRKTNEIIKSNYGPQVDITAPGELIRAASIKDYRPLSGSSIACAYVTGVAACLLEAEPNLTPAELKSMLIKNSRKNPSQNISSVLGEGATRMVFNPLQLLKPRWDRTQSLLGVFAWNDSIEAKFKCQSRIGDQIKYELINCELPDGIQFDQAGLLKGNLKKPENSETETEYYNLLVRAKDSSGEADRMLYFIATTPDKVDSLKMQQGLVRLAGGKGCCDRWCDPWPYNHAPCCVTGETLITTPIGKIPAAQLEIGMEVFGTNSEIQKIVDFIEVDLAGRQLYSVNGGEAFFTEEHPLVGPGGEFAVNPTFSSQLTRRPIQQLEVGTKLYVEQNGIQKIIEVVTLQGANCDQEKPVYDLILDGSGIYIANGFAMKSKFVLGVNMAVGRDLKLSLHRQKA